jgi:hypothetical protein
VTEGAPRAPKRDWGEGCTMLVVAALLFALQNRYTLGGTGVGWVIGLVFAAMCISTFVVTAVGSRKWANLVLIVGAGILALSNLAMVLRVIQLILYSGNTPIDGIRLLETALAIWVSNVVLFSIVYRWVGEREFLFPKRDGEPAPPLVFLDFLFLAFAIATAFSPTDTAPLTTRTRMFVMVESIISLTMIALAAARAVNILT